MFNKQISESSSVQLHAGSGIVRIDPLFPGQMSYKATKPGLMCLSYLSMFLLCCYLLGPFLYCAQSLAAQCIVISPVCVRRAGGRCVFVALWVCYHDNSKLRATIFTKLGLQVKVVTISSCLTFSRPAPLGRGSAAGRKFLAPPLITTAIAQCLRLSERFFIYRICNFFHGDQSKKKTGGI